MKDALALDSVVDKKILNEFYLAATQEEGVVGFIVTGKSIREPFVVEFGKLNAPQWEIYEDGIRIKDGFLPLSSILTLTLVRKGKIGKK